MSIATMFFFFFSSRRRHTRYIGDWSSDVCSSDLATHTGDVITYRVEQDKKLRDVRVRFESPVTNSRMIVSMILSTLLALSFAAIGLMVYVRRSDDRQAFVFYVMAIVGSLSYLAGIIISFDGSNLRGITTTQSSALAVVAAYLTI